MVLDDGLWNIEEVYFFKSLKKNQWPFFSMLLESTLYLDFHNLFFLLRKRQAQQSITLLGTHFSRDISSKVQYFHFSVTNFYAIT